MVNILLLEDEAYTRKFFKQLLLNNPLIANVYDTSSCREAVKLAEKHKPEIAMLDIELGAAEAMNGLEVAKIITSLLPETIFVFVTGYTKYAIDSFAVHPFDYIVKPVNKERISEVIVKIVNRLNNSVTSQKENKLTLKNKEETYFVKPGDVIFIERNSRDTLVHTKYGIYIVSENLNNLEKILGDNFLRVHQSFLINLEKIKMIKSLGNRSFDIEFLEYNKNASMSRYKFEEFKEKFAPLL
ncbi:MAG: LytR/AlgR family response regulator transcription factor [Peptococcaceae bacterium]